MANSRLKAGYVILGLWASLTASQRAGTCGGLKTKQTMKSPPVRGRVLARICPLHPLHCDDEAPWAASIAVFIEVYALHGGVEWQVDVLLGRHGGWQTNVLAAAGEQGESPACLQQQACVWRNSASTQA